MCHQLLLQLPFHRRMMNGVRRLFAQLTNLLLAFSHLQYGLSQWSAEQHSRSATHDIPCVLEIHSDIDAASTLCS